jgi:hypothetical protein
MSATVISMHDFIEALRMRVPTDIHPSARCIIHEYLGAMRDAIDDPAHVVKLATMVREKIVDELRWEAEKYASVCDYREAYRLRHRADRFES